jgi:hypothetical protein
MRKTQKLILYPGDCASSLEILLLLANIILLCVISFIGVVNACSCVGEISISDAYNMSSFIFLGVVTNRSSNTLISITTNTSTTISEENDYYFYPKVMVQMDVIECFKGDCNSTETVTTPASSASCGYNDFIPEEESSSNNIIGEAFLIYATVDPETAAMSVISCSRTTHIDPKVLHPVLEITALYHELSASTALSAAVDEDNDTEKEEEDAIQANYDAFEAQFWSYSYSYRI